MCCTRFLRSGAPVTAVQAEAVVTMAENLGLEVTLIKKSAEEEVAQEIMELEELQQTTRGHVQEPVKPSPHAWTTPYHANSQRSRKESPGHVNLPKKRKESSFRENESPIPLPAKGYRKHQPRTDPDPDKDKQHDKLTREEIKVKREFDQQELRKEKKKMRKEQCDKDKQAKKGTTSKSKLSAATV